MFDMWHCGRFETKRQHFFNFMHQNFQIALIINKREHLNIQQSNEIPDSKPTKTPSLELE